MAEKKKAGILENITNPDVLLNIVSSNSYVSAEAIKSLLENIKELSDSQLERFYKLDVSGKIPEIKLEMNIRKQPWK